MDFVPFPNLHRETIFQDFSECRTILVSGSVGLLHSLTGHSLKVLLRTHRNHYLGPACNHTLMPLMPVSVELGPVYTDFQDVNAAMSLVISL